VAFSDTSYEQIGAIRAFVALSVLRGNTMTLIAGIGFTSPMLLLMLLVLPVLWAILRAVPPAPVKRAFPGVILLLGLQNKDSEAERTPWWLLLLRALAIAALIIGLAGPVLRPQDPVSRSDAPLLVLFDGGWGAASDWPTLQEAVRAHLHSSGAHEQLAAIYVISTPSEITFQSVSALEERLAGIKPRPWHPSQEMLARTQAELETLKDFDTLWVSDGLDYPGRAALLSTLETKGHVTVLATGRSVLGLLPAEYEAGVVTLTARRTPSEIAAEYTVLAQGTDPAGNAATLAQGTIRFDAETREARAQLTLPAELRARITYFTIDQLNTAGATTLIDDTLRRREVALIAGRGAEETEQLLSPLHYLEQALTPSVDLLQGALLDILPANPDVIILSDIATLSVQETQALTAWIETGGLLVRFAGPRLAASDVSRASEDPLLPVRLRAGGRAVGGAMSWGSPKTLAPFPRSSPFYGLAVPEDVSVRAQVVAQPGPELAERAIATLSDGTPLITRKMLGAGQVVLFHITANAEWSSLPLSGLFVQMLERLSVLSSTVQPEIEDLENTIWSAETVLDGFGNLIKGDSVTGVEGPALVSSPLGPTLLPGVYQFENRALARNVLGGEAQLTPATWPSTVLMLDLAPSPQLPLAGWILLAGLGLLVVDILVSLAMSGRLFGARGGLLATAALAVLAQPPNAQATMSGAELARAASAEVVLAHVLTGNAEVDEIANAGLSGLSQALYLRTSVEPATPIGVDLETDELAFFPLLYWPITESQPIPSDQAYAKLNSYLRSGGMILFDTRDAHLAGFGRATPEGQHLQRLAAPLDIPRLGPFARDHVLTRSFYLMQDFPGRHMGRDIWLEAPPPDASAIEGMPFRNLNDGVSPVVIGGNDWAAAWAVSPSGAYLRPVGHGRSGELQREYAYRFGINLVMYVLTGNYKSDQVHVPDLLERLGQ
jgi:hypothetical protein